MFRELVLGLAVVRACYGKDIPEPVANGAQAPAQAQPNKTTSSLDDMLSGNPGVAADASDLGGMGTMADLGDADNAGDIDDDDGDDVLPNRYFFILYTSTGFNPKGPQPNGTNALGVGGDGDDDSTLDASDKPANATDPLGNESNAIQPNHQWPWTYYFAYDANQFANANVYNYASFDSVTNKSQLPANMPPSADPSMQEQVEKFFVPTQADPNTRQWNESTAVAGIYIGLMDIIDGTIGPKSAGLQAQQDSLLYLLNELYHAGIRKFFFLNLPPVDRYPEIDNAETWESRINDYNSALNKTVAAFQTGSSNATTYIFDQHSQYERVLDNPQRYAFDHTANVTINHDITANDTNNNMTIWDESYFATSAMSSLISDALVDDQRGLPDNFLF
ncbi:MAG: hypothetical protein M1838_002517 [Thelocarpon superellum]|nr:MAG: hypothetical protein M1838_002517 [Thelocarpon superellum]